MARRHKAAVQIAGRSGSGDAPQMEGGDTEQMEVDDASAQIEGRADAMIEQEKPEADRGQQEGEDGEILTDDEKVGSF